MSPFDHLWPCCRTGPHQRATRAGFSVLEAVIVLAITGLALTIVFSIGSRASEMGFRLGRSVLAVGDSEVARESFHDLVSGMIVPTTVDDPKGAIYAPPSLVGDGQHLQAGVVLGRSTPCANQGPAGITDFTLTSGPDAALQCKAHDGSMVRLMSFKGHPAKFSYSTDAVSWTDRIQIDPGPVRNADGVVLAASGAGRTIFIKVASEDGAVLLIERASTGRPVPHPIQRADF